MAGAASGRVGLRRLDGCGTLPLPTLHSHTRAPRRCTQRTPYSRRQRGSRRERHCGCRGPWRVFRAARGRCLCSPFCFSQIRPLCSNDFFAALTGLAYWALILVSYWPLILASHTGRSYWPLILLALGAFLRCCCFEHTLVSPPSFGDPAWFQAHASIAIFHDLKQPDTSRSPSVRVHEHAIPPSFDSRRRCAFIVLE
jgi:hypothetical protein